MADKIDQLTIGSTSYDIDLPPDATPSIASLTVSGTTDVSAGTLKAKTINIPTSSGGSTYGPGSSGQVLKSNGTTVYWASDSNSNYYPTAMSWTNGTTAGPTATITMSGTSNISVGAIPAASNSQSGIVTTGDQTFSGVKTINDIRLENTYATDIWGKTSQNGLRLYDSSDEDCSITLYGGIATIHGDEIHLNTPVVYVGDEDNEVQGVIELYDVNGAGYTEIYSDDGDIWLESSGGEKFKLQPSDRLIQSYNGTSSKNYYFPEKSGIVALTNDLPQIIDLR